MIKRKGFALVAAIVIIGALAIIGGCGSHKFEKIGHRGDTDYYPENTLQSFQSALDKGLDGIELDVHYTNSGDLLVFHDIDLSRVCGNEISISEVSLETRENYPVNLEGYDYSESYYIPTLDEVLSLVKERYPKARVFIHLKPEKEDFGSQGTDKVLNLIKSLGLEKNVVVFSANKETLVRFNNSGISLGWLSKAKKYEKSVEEMDWCINNGVQYLFCFKPVHISEDVVKYGHSHDMTVGMYKAQTTEDIEYVERLGADFVMIYHSNTLK